MTQLKYPKKDDSRRESWASLWTTNPPFTTFLEEGSVDFAHLFGVCDPEKGFPIRKRCIYHDIESWYEPIREKYIHEYSAEDPASLKARIFGTQPRAKSHHQLLVRGFLATIPMELAFLEEILKQATYILDFEDGWDGEDATAFQYATWIRAASFLIDYYKYIFSNSGKVLPAPEFVHSSKGSIDLLWRKDGIQLLINVPEGDQSITFFGFNADDESVKGKFKYPSPKFSIAIAIANLF